MQLFFFEVLMIHENIELLPPSDSSDLSLGNYDPSGGITIVLVGKYFKNQLGRMEVANED